MLGIIERYIIQKIIGFCALVSLIFLSLVSLFEFIELLRRSTGRYHVPMITLFEMVLLKVPHNWQHFLVFLFFFGALMAFWILNQNQELCVVQASGISPLRLLKTITVSALGILLFQLFILNPLGCAMRERFLNLDERYFGGKTTLSVQGSSLWLKEANPLSLFHAQTFHLGQATFWNVRFFDFSKGYKSYYFAKKAKLLPDKKWQLEDVMWWNALGQQGKLKTMTRPTQFSLKKIERVQRSPDTVPFFNLQDYSKSLAQHGFSVTRYDLYWHSSLAKGILMIFLGLLAMALCLRSPRYHGSTKITGLGILICFLLHFAQDLLYALSLAGNIPIWLACWGFPLSLNALGMSWLTRT